MTLAPNQGPTDGDADFRRALIRSLTHISNELARGRSHTNDNFRRYGVLIEGLLTHCERLQQQNNHILAHLEITGGELKPIKDDTTRLLQLGLWWEDQKED